MMLDKICGVIAPNTCLSCGDEGYVLCDSCLETAGEPIAPRCVGCQKLSDSFKTCVLCKKWLKVDNVYVATSYEGIYERLIRALKYDVKRQAASPVANLMNEAIDSELDGVLCPVPTAPARIRERGFDHTKLISQYLSKYSGIHQTQLLGRKTNVRQVGSSKTERIEHMENEFYAKSPESIKGKNIILVDDVITTGASLSGAANKLINAGAKSVRAIVFAQKI